MLHFSATGLNAPSPLTAASFGSSVAVPVSHAGAKEKSGHKAKTLPPIADTCRLSGLPIAPPVDEVEIKTARKAARKARRKKTLLGTLATLLLSPIWAPAAALGFLSTPAGQNVIMASPLGELQNKLFFDYDTHPVRSPQEVLEPTLASRVEVVSFETPTGEKMNGWYIPPTDPKAPTVMYVHGRAGNIASGSNAHFVNAFANRGYGFFMFDPPGYGNSEGTPSEQGWFTAAQSASDWLAKARKTPVEEQVLVGYSMGGAAVIDLAREKPFKAVATVSTFTSINDVIRHHNEHSSDDYPVPDAAHKLFLYAPFTVDVLNPQPFDSIAKIDEVSTPNLMIYYAQDDVYIPTAHSRELAQEADPASLKILAALPGDHSSVTQAAGQIAEDLDLLLKRDAAK